MPKPKNTNAELLVQYKDAVARDDKKAIKRIEGQVVSDNMNLVRKLVSRLMSRLTSGTSVSEEEMMQAGQIGLLRAWRGLDPARGKLSTYAAHWIRHEFQDALGDSVPIYRPRNSGKPWQVHNAQERIRARTGRAATVEEINADLTAKAVKFRITEAQLETWRNTPQVHSLDEPMSFTQVRAVCIREGQPVDSHDMIEDKSKPTPEQAFSHAELGALFAEGMADLDDREVYVIEHLFVEQESYKEVAACLGISEELVRQARLSALEKLRARVT